MLVGDPLLVQHLALRIPHLDTAVEGRGEEVALLHPQSHQDVRVARRYAEGGRARAQVPHDQCAPTIRRQQHARHLHDLHGRCERAVWAGGVGGRCGGMCGWAVWSALHLCGCTMWGAWLGGAWLGGAWLGGARAAWMGEVCPARLTTGSNFSFANFQVLTPVSSPPEKRNSPAPRHAGYHPLTRRLRCHGTRCAVRTLRPEASTPYGHGSSAPGQAALRGTAPALRTCQHRCSPPCARQ